MAYNIPRRAVHLNLKQFLKVDLSPIFEIKDVLWKTCKHVPEVQAKTTKIVVFWYHHQNKIGLVGRDYFENLFLLKSTNFTPNFHFYSKLY